MCRSLATTGRRCPCSAPHRRSALDRARYAAKKAARATHAPLGAPGAPQPLVPKCPEPEEILARATAVADAYDNAWAGGDSDRVFDAQAQIKEWAGDREQAVVKVGHMVRERAEMHAGITADEVEQSWNERRAVAKAEVERRVQLSAEKAVELDIVGLQKRYRAAQDDLRDAQRAQADEETLLAKDRALTDARRAYDEADDTARAYIRQLAIHEATDRYNATENGTDPETLEHLDRLNNGYRQALAELRPTGGTMQWDQRSAKKARELFDRAVQVYPSAWIDASNKRAAPVAKSSKARAHYSDGAKQVTRKRENNHGRWLFDKGVDPNDEQRRDGRWGLTEDYVIDNEYNDSNRYRTEVAWTRRRYELHTDWKHGEVEPGGSPSGRGWEKVTYESGGETHETWRRPIMKTRETSREYTPEITVGARGSVLGGDGYSTATHELGHRFEASVPMISQMEREFVIRRTTTDGQRDKQVLYAGTGRNRELTRPDSFADVYMGKEYAGSPYYEVLTTGAEGLFAGRFGGLVGVAKARRDDDMRAFILGVLATARPSTPQPPREARTR